MRSNELRQDPFIRECLLLLAPGMETYRGIKPLNQINGIKINHLGAILLGACAGVGVVWLLQSYFRKQNSQVFTSESEFTETSTPLVKRFAYGTRDEVEEASWESFPASDPPAW